VILGFKMALNENLLSLLMLSTSGLPTLGAKQEFDAYAKGVIAGIKLGTATITTTGALGTPGTAKFIGAINPGPLLMASLIQVAAVGSLPPIPGGTPTPLQFTFFLALGQIATHVLAFLEVEGLPMDTVSTGIGIVPPGGFTISGDLIQGLIVLEFIKAGLITTPSRVGLAAAVGRATEQFMLLATIPTIPIVGGAPVAPPAPSVGTRIGIIS